MVSSAGFYDAIENPRATRNELPILRGDELRSYLEDVRERALEVLDGIDLESAEDPLLAGGFVYELLIAHEHQHTETMLQLIQMVDGYEPVEVVEPPAPDPAASDGPEMVLVEGGAVEIGAGPDGFAYDNERPRHTVELDAFLIDRTAGDQPRVRRVPRATRAPSRRCTGRRTARLVGAHRDGPPRAGRSRRSL